MDMLLLCMTISCLLFGTSAVVENEELCYGRSLQLPFSYTPPYYKGPLYFTPRGEGRSSRRIIMDKGVAKVPRLRVTTLSVRLMDLRETDEGTYSVSYGPSSTRDIIKLKILDCAEDSEQYYGQTFTFKLSTDAEYVEFTPLSSTQSMILWNRTSSRTYKDNVEKSWDIIDIKRLTKADSGHYSFRRKDNTLLSRYRLEVKANQLNYEKMVDERLYMTYPFPSSWTVTFTREGESEEDVLIREGNLVYQIHSALSPFTGRFEAFSEGISIAPLRTGDSGTFEFKDQDGTLAQRVQLEVMQGVVPTYIYIIVGAVIVTVLICCCCCVKKCCCKKSSSKRDESAVRYLGQTQLTSPTNTTAAAAATPTPVYTYQPLAPKEPATSNPRLMYPPVNVHVNPSRPEVTPPEQQIASPAPEFNSIFLSSDPDPKFEPKGTIFPSAPPLSSDSAVCDVYNSDKLNFL